MAIALRGQRARPQYEDLVGIARSDGLGDVNSLIVMRSFRVIVLFWVNLVAEA